MDLSSWRVAFLVNVPLVALALWATLRHVPESRDETATGRLDWLGSIVIAVAVGGISFGLIRGQESAVVRPDRVRRAGASASSAAIAFPILMVTPPRPAGAAGALPAPRVHGHQHRPRS